MIGDKRGLTLMELLVVMGVFSLTVTITTAIFLLSNRAQRRVLAVSAAQADLRFALETMVREIRAGQIDYDAYAASGGVQIPADHLRIKSASGRKLDFYAETNPAICPSGVAKCLVVKVDGTPQSVTSSAALLQKLNFIITPSADPFSLDATSGLYKADAQPLVTTAIQIKTQGPKPEDIVTMNAQTSVTSRLYVR